MRRFIPLVLVGILALSACGGDPPVPTPQPTSTIAVKEEPTKVPSTPTVGAMNDEELAEKLAPSTVLILAQFAESAIDVEGLGGGTGVVYDKENGYIITNAHVVEGASVVKVSTAGNNKQRSARVVGRSQCDDLAVLKVENTDGLVEAPLGESSSMKVGAHVLALGYPEMFDLGTDLTVSPGVVSKLSTQRYQYEDLIQTNAAITHGNSGGPLVNSRGEVIGINTLGFYSASGEREPNINFAIAMSHAKPIIKQLEEGKNRHYLGLNLYPNVFSDYFGTEEGLVVVGRASGSPASQVGIQQEDLLLKMEGTTIKSDEDVCNILRSHGDGDQLKVEIFRKATGEILEGELTLGKTGAGVPGEGGLKVVRKLVEAEAEPTSTPASGTDPGDEAEYVDVYQNNFDSGDATGLDIVQDESGITTSVADGRFTINIPPAGLTYYVPADGTEGISDGIVAAEVQPEGSGWAGVIGRYTRAEDGELTTTYYCYITNAGESACYKIVDSEWDLIAPVEANAAIKPNEINTLIMAVVGNQVLFQVNGEIVANVTDDTPLAAGAWGLTASTTQEVPDFKAHYNEVYIAKSK